jgi:hypothetical protein
MKNSFLSGFILIFLTFFTNTGDGQNYVEIGAGTIQNSMPIYSSWNYSWSSLIYNHSDLGAAKTITAIGLNCVNGPKTVTNQKIYVKLSTSEVFANANYEDPLNNGYTLVFEGNLSFQTGWNEIPLTTPIAYDGVQNIVFHWENRWNNTYGPIFNSTPSVINNNKNCGSDVSFPGPGSSGYLNPYPNSLTNTRFYYTSSGPVTPFNPTPTDNATRVSVDTDLSWQLGANTSSFDLYFGTTPSNLSLIGNNLPAFQGTNSFVLDGLLADSTMHYWRVVAKNGSQQESSPIWKFKTEVVIDEFPYFQGFEDSTVFNTWPVQSAWQTIPEFSWYEMDVNANSGLLCAKSFFLNSNLQAILLSPKVLLPENHRITYNWANEDARVSNHDTTYFEISTDGGLNWVILDYLSPEVPATYTERSHNLNTYAGNNFFFRFRYRTDNTSNASSVYLDDIIIEEMSEIQEIELSSSTLPFRELYVNGNTTGQITITNTGNVNLSISSISVSPPFSCNYSGTLLPGEWVNPTVYFNATQAGSFNNVLTVNIEGEFSGNNTVQVSGTVLENNADLFEAFDTSNNIPDHWNKIKSATDLYNDVTIETSSFDSHSVPNVAKMLNANDSISPLIFILPGITGFGDHELSFYAKKGGEYYDLDIIVGLMDDPYNAESFVPVQTFELNDTHSLYTLSFAAGNVMPYVAFRHANNVQWSSIWIDDVMWTNPNTQDPPNPAVCSYPANNAIDVDLMMPENYLVWANGGGNPSGFYLSFGTNNPPTNLLNMVNLGDTVIYQILNELSYSTKYYWQVVPYNSNGNAINCPVWEFTTMADPTKDEYPLIENFDGLVAGSAFYYPPFMMGNIYPLGWTVLSIDNQPMSWTMISNTANNPGVAHSAPNAMHMGWGFSNAMDEWLITPPLVMSPDKAYNLRFYYKTANVGLSTSEKLEVVAGTGPDPAAMTLGQLFNNNNITNLEYETGAGVFTPPSYGTYYLAFHGYSDALQFLLFIDDVLIQETPLTGLETINSDDLISIYPNPGDGHITVKHTIDAGENGEIQVCDMAGRIVYTAHLAAMKHEIDLSHLDAGPYVVKIKTVDHQYQQLVIIR